MSLEVLSVERFEILRTSYGYVPARLVSSSIKVTPSISHSGIWLVPWLPPPADWAREDGRKGYSSIKLDALHNELLVSKLDLELLHGLLSVVFWGYTSGANGRTRLSFALERAQRILRGFRVRGGATPSIDIIVALRDAHQLLVAREPGEALKAVMRIKFLGMSFASKVVTFINPVLT